jgi:hypothetical protein
MNMVNNMERLLNMVKYRPRMALELITDNTPSTACLKISVDKSFLWPLHADINQVKPVI